MSDHGYGKYTNGCRCDVCRQAKADYSRERRAKARALAQKYSVDGWRYVAPIERHGTRFGYEEAGCRCPECTHARTSSDVTYARSRRAKAAS